MSDAIDTDLAKNPSVRRVEALKMLQPNKFELWKYYEDRADKLGERLWSIGIWLIAIISATLTLPFAGNLIKVDLAAPYIKITAPIAVALISIFGALICTYSYFALRDVREHIQSNWRKSGYILEGTWKDNWGGRKASGWNVLVVIGVLSLSAFVGLLILSLAQR